MLYTVIHAIQKNRPIYDLSILLCCLSNSISLKQFQRRENLKTNLASPRVRAKMAPKTRSGKVVGTIVTKKVVEETVQVVVSPGENENGENERERVEVVSESIKENEKVEVISSSAKGPVKMVVVGDRAEKEDQQTPPEQPEEGREQKNQENVQPEQQQQKEQEQVEQQPDQGKDQQQPDEEDVQQENEAEDEETQPASQPEVTPAPTPPKFEAPPRKDEEENIKKRKNAEEKVKESQKKNTAQKGGEEVSGKRRKKRARVGGGVGEDYKRYVFRVMKQVHPDMGISSKAMTIINNLMSDMFERIANEASTLSKYVGRTTLSAREIQDAVKLVLPGDLGKHAIAEGSKAVNNYVANVTGDSKFKSKSKS